ncbi:hypothetical protein AC578_4236 [Pseudocercospora eumusae]|uniref:Uncharacterized protein n=1 Tax=Pseudocercospora eumusae TaxID=321146 RepID=A0A139H389_9PEZI|nr:hypothetical protein AC578_4236 [Pseudocercospora eumusae]
MSQNCLCNALHVWCEYGQEIRRQNDDRSDNSPGVTPSTDGHGLVKGASRRLPKILIPVGMAAKADEDAGRFLETPARDCVVSPIHFDDKISSRL